MIPEFDECGLLPPGVHPAEWEELEARFGTTAHRRWLLAGLLRALKNLAAAGCRLAYVDGSFVTSKEIPGDWDGCWEEAGVDPTLLDPVLLDFTARRAVQKAKYLGEFFPARSQAEATPPFRIFLDFLQTDQVSGDLKGIVSVDLTRLPT